MKEKADLVITRATIYTADRTNSRAEAMAIRQGKIMAVGTSGDILNRYEPEVLREMQGKYIYPGFIDAHCHFFGYAVGLQYVTLNGCTSFDEVLQRLPAATELRPGQWVVGRGWDQNLWPGKSFPENSRLNERYPANPVLLIRVDGHMVLANQAALDQAGIRVKNRFGKQQVWVGQGRLTGILCESAADAMRESVPQPEKDQLSGLLKKAELNCFEAGLTGVGDAGLDYDQAVALDQLHQDGTLKIFIYGMLSPEKKNIENFIRKGPYLTDGVSYRSIKIYADGSLGSRTAKLKKPYADDTTTSGILVTAGDSIFTLCRLAYDKGYQVNTHCIGDSSVKLVLLIYSRFLKEMNDLRWRIEHAQVVDSADLHLFRQYSVIPSVQATHATSDMRWAGERLGPQRVKGAYAYKALLRENTWLANGTDFPIEQIAPLLTFFASVARKDITGYPDGGFQPENALTREEALRSITIWAAKACFLEDKKGSLEAGKDADFVILDQDIMAIPEMKIPGIKVTGTYIRGSKVSGE